MLDVQFTCSVSVIQTKLFLLTVSSHLCQLRNCFAEIVVQLIWKPLLCTLYSNNHRHAFFCHVITLINEFKFKNFRSVVYFRKLTAPSTLLSSHLLHSNGLTLKVKLSDPNWALLAIQMLSNTYNETSKLDPMAITSQRESKQSMNQKSFRRQ